MNTRKDYERAAKIVRSVIAQKSREEIEAAFVVFFLNDNPRFDIRRFRQACTIKQPRTYA